MFFWLFKICALSSLHRGSLNYRFWFENSRGRLNGLRVTNSDSSVGKMRLKEQKSIFTGLWMSDDFSKPVGKSRSPKYPQGFFKNHNFMLFVIQQRTHAHSVFCLGVSRPFASDTSPKWVDREGLGKHRTGTRQDVYHQLKHRLQAPHKVKKVIFHPVVRTDGRTGIRLRAYQNFSDAWITRFS